MVRTADCRPSSRPFSFRRKGLLFQAAEDERHIDCADARRKGQHFRFFRQRSATTAPAIDDGFRPSGLTAV